MPPLLIKPIQHNFSRACEVLMYRLLTDRGCNRSNLLRWNFIFDDTCPLCTSQDTMCHIVFSCVGIQSEFRYHLVNFLNSYNLSSDIFIINMLFLHINHVILIKTILGLCQDILKFRSDL